MFVCVCVEDLARSMTHAIHKYIKPENGPSVTDNVRHRTPLFQS